MLLQSFQIKNFRRLKKVHVELDQETSIFVGANNSGKTTATQAFQLFLGASRDRFSIYDFNIECWEEFDSLGFTESTGGAKSLPPTINLDLWFTVEADDLHRVIDLLPSLEWDGAPVGVRLEYAPRDPAGMMDNYHEAKKNAVSAIEGKTDEFHPWPKSLTDYLTKRLNSEYSIHYYILDHAQFDDDYNQTDDYVPAVLGDNKSQTGRNILRSLLRVDFLNAQRHLSDASSSGGRADNLSNRLSRFYDRNLEKQDEDYAAIKALSDSEEKLNEHLANVFKPTLDSLASLGYPGFSDPHLVIKSALNPESLLNQGAVVHYALNDPNSSGGGSQTLSLPDRYNGLGYKNLIFMVVELLDFHEQWMDEEVRPPLHLVFIEEPEAHLHVQLQQVFINQVGNILKQTENESEPFNSQLIVTTHSPHIIYESGFDPIRYFRRMACPAPQQQSVVLNLSLFNVQEVGATAPEDMSKERVEALKFLQRYMKLTHCDLFFADGAILVEGNVERLLLPIMIEKSAPELKSCYLSILEVGGAFAHRFRELIDFLGITTLVITDIDSIHPKEAPKDEEAQEEEENAATGSCMTTVPDAVTSNQTLIKWIPQLTNVTDLLDADDSKKQLEMSGKCPGQVRVAYQTRQPISWEGDKDEIAGRTLEEAFALENIDWCQDLKRRPLGLRVITKTKTLPLAEVANKLYSRVGGASFNKTKFALGLLMENDADWVVPAYIHDGLEWLAAEMPTKKDILNSDTQQTNKEDGNDK